MKSLGVISIIVGIIFIAIPIFMLFSYALGIHRNIGAGGFMANIVLFSIGLVVGIAGVLIFDEEGVL